MQNLHIKNLNNTHYINIYIDSINKKLQSTNNTKELYITKTSYKIEDYFDTTDYEESFDDEDFTEYKNIYYITPITYTRICPFGETERRYLDISIKNNKVTDINVNW